MSTIAGLKTLADSVNGTAYAFAAVGSLADQMTAANHVVSGLGSLADSIGTSGHAFAAVRSLADSIDGPTVFNARVDEITTLISFRDTTTPERTIDGFTIQSDDVSASIDIFKFDSIARALIFEVIRTGGPFGLICIVLILRTVFVDGDTGGRAPTFDGTAAILATAFFLVPEFKKLAEKMTRRK